MWLPEPIYEALPYVYLAMGAAFLAGAIYIGIGHSPTAYYFALGIVSILAGVVIHLRRATARRHKNHSGMTESH
jgi:hypothetical protein